MHAGRRRQVAIIAAAGVLGAALSAVLVGRVMSVPAQNQGRKISADEARLLERAALEKARAAAQAQKLRQHEIGQGIRFDAEGNLIEGSPEGTSDLPQNKALEEAASGGVPTSEIAQGITRPRARPPAPAAGEDYEDPAVDPDAPSQEPGHASDEEAGRSDPTQTMLGYSTVRAARWAARRPESADAPSGQGAPRKTSEEQDSEAMGKAAKAMEDSVNMAAAGGTVERGGALSAFGPGDGAGLGTSGAPQVAPGPSARGNALYAETGAAPAEHAPQMFAAGGVGDMRIAGAVGSDYVVRQGKFLDSVLVTRLQADLVDSPVIAMVSRDFVTLDGKYVLVPAGSKLLGAAGAIGNLQQARVYMKFDRIVFPDQRAAYFPVRKVPAVDRQGAVGIEGNVDRHLMLQFGAAVMLGMIDGLGAAVQGLGSAAQPTLRELVAARASANFSQVVAGVIQKYANVVPTVTVEPGATMKIFFAEDVRMSPYLSTSDLSWVRSGR